MAVAADYTALVQQLYVSYFGRPADTLGLENFANQLVALNAPTTLTGLNAAVKTNAALQTLVNSFGTSQESADLYGTGDNISFVSAIYQNLLNRTPDFDGLKFWVNAINSGQLTRANASVAIAAATSTNTSTQGVLDAALIKNKTAVATSFTTAIDTGAELAAYRGPVAAAAARNLLATVTADTNTTTFQSAVEASIANIVTVTQPTVITGLTVGIDNLPGSTSNDVFNALNINATSGLPAVTLTGFDVVDGAAGNDTLNIYSSDGTNEDLNNATIRNVETINIINEATVDADLFGTTAQGGVVDASKFVGATAVWQIGAKAAEVNGLSATTTAGFRGTADDSLKVVAANAVAGIALDGVSGDAGANVVTLDVSGAALSAVNVSGSIVKNAAAAAAAPSVALNITAGKDVTGITVNTGVDSTVSLFNNGKAIDTLNATASTGMIKFNGAAAVTTVSTGAGNDNVTVASALNGTIKAASVMTAAGNDTIVANVATTGNGNTVMLDSGEGNDTVTVNATAGGTGNTVTVNAGAGNDTVTATLVAGIAYTVNAGAGDDKVALNGANVKTTDVIDGGEGKDTVELAGALSYVADDYIVFNKVLKNFEGLAFTSAAGTTAAIDAGQVAGYKSFSFVAGTNKITNVGADQSLSTAGNLDAQGAGYVDAGKLGTTTLNIAATNDATIVARAAAVNLSVTALSKAAAGAVSNVDVILEGSFATAAVALAAGKASNDSATVASVTVTTATAAVTTGLTFTGSGSATVISTDIDATTASKLVNVDASGLAGEGLTLVSSSMGAETIKLGAGTDDVTLNDSTYGKHDTVTGLSLVMNGAALDVAKTDSLTVGAASVFTKFTTTQTDLDLALKDASASTTANSVVFQMGGDTYVYVDAGTADSVDAADTVVKLTGAINLDALILSLA